jgi:hypothetical protein
MAMITAPPLTEDEVQQLPRWARVAFAARCLRRVQPLLRRFWENPPADILAVFDQAVAASELSATQANCVTELDDVLKSAERYAPPLAGMPQVRPYGTPPGTISSHHFVHYAIACAAISAIQCAKAAAGGDDEACADAAYRAYGWAVHAGNLVQVAGLDRVLQADLRALQEAASRGEFTEMTPVGPELFALEKELRTYRRELPHLLQQGEGKFALIHEETLDGIWDTYEDALQAGFNRYQLMPFLVKRIRAGEDVG